MNKELFERVVAIFNTGDVSHVEAIFGQNYLDHQKPDWLTVAGPEEFKQIVQLARTSLPGLTVTIVGPLIADKDMVAGRLRWTNDTVERETIEILRMSGGQFVEHWGAEAWSRPKSADN